MIKLVSAVFLIYFELFCSNDATQNTRSPQKSTKYRVVIGDLFSRWPGGGADRPRGDIAGGALSKLSGGAQRGAGIAYGGRAAGPHPIPDLRSSPMGLAVFDPSGPFRSGRER